MVKFSALSFEDHRLEWTEFVVVHDSPSIGAGPSMALVENSTMVNRQTKFCPGGLSSSRSHGQLLTEFLCLFVFSCNSTEFKCLLGRGEFREFVRISLRTDCCHKNLPYLSYVCTGWQWQVRFSCLWSLIFCIIIYKPSCMPGHKRTSLFDDPLPLYLFATVVTPLEFVVSWSINSWIQSVATSRCLYPLFGIHCFTYVHVLCTLSKKWGCLTTSAQVCVTTLYLYALWYGT